jgi:hypothetical protein
MSTDSQSDADAGSMSPKLKDECERFNAAYAEWLAARADIAARHVDESDEAEVKRYDREREAELAFATTPAPHSTAVWRKWGFVDYLMTDDIDCGSPRYPLAVVARASLKADVAALGLNPWPAQ